MACLCCLAGGRLLGLCRLSMFVSRFGMDCGGCGLYCLLLTFRLGSCDYRFQFMCVNFERCMLLVG